MTPINITSGVLRTPFNLKKDGCFKECKKELSCVWESCFKVCGWGFEDLGCKNQG